MKSLTVRFPDVADGYPTVETSGTITSAEVMDAVMFLVSDVECHLGRDEFRKFLMILVDPHHQGLVYFDEPQNRNVPRRLN